ncbi:hypothetical protein WDW89_14210 [Deltaproteobacteria bacterium TL4]
MDREKLALQNFLKEVEILQGQLEHQEIDAERYDRYFKYLADRHVMLMEEIHMGKAQLEQKFSRLERMVDHIRKKGRLASVQNCVKALKKIRKPSSV